jgi:chromosomal replication initiator protein
VLDIVNISNHNDTSQARATDLQPDNVDKPDQLLTREALQEGWTQILSRMRHDLGDSQWRCWIRNLKLIGLHKDKILVGAESKLIMRKVASQYQDRLLANCKIQWDYINSIDIDLIRAGARLPERPHRATEQDEFQAQPVPAATPASDRGDAIDAFENIGGLLDPRMTFDNFIVDRSNQLAHAAAMRMTESEYPVYNPLFLHGGVGLGKTHLMHAIAWEIRKKFASRRVLYLSAEVFMHRFIKALRHRNTTEFKEEFRSVDVLMVDDVQFIAGKETTQEEFFHTFNALVDQNKQIIISADKSPTDLSGMEERLRSRLNWGMVADIHPTTFELRVGILQAKAEAQQVDLPDSVLEFLAHKITSNVRELEGALNRLAAYTTLGQKSITIDSVYDVLSDVIRASNRQISIGEIQRQVAQHFNIRLDEMHSKRRSRNIVHPRQIAMYLAKHMTSSSYPEIGQQFGGRDHTTVMHAVSKIEKSMQEDASVMDDIKILKTLLSTS